MIPCDNGTKKVVIKWFGVQERASWVVVNDKNAQFGELDIKWNEWLMDDTGKWQILSREWQQVCEPTVLFLCVCIAFFGPVL